MLAGSFTRPVDIAQGDVIHADYGPLGTVGVSFVRGSSLPGAYVAEALVGSGFDWMLFDTEHSPGDPLTVLAQLRAVARCQVSPVVRPLFAHSGRPQQRLWTTKLPQSRSVPTRMQ